MRQHRGITKTDVRSERSGGLDTEASHTYIRDDIAWLCRQHGGITRPTSLKVRVANSFWTAVLRKVQLTTRVEKEGNAMKALIQEFLLAVDTLTSLRAILCIGDKSWQLGCRSMVIKKRLNPFSPSQPQQLA
ncbi:hypothetical protein KM043_013245 [Ampulex compressa]|nr:hypothetical protein KM043_013245 [Ampulex compressa]